MLGDALARGAHARQVRRGLEAGGGDGLHGVQRLLARRAAGAVGDAEELGLQRAELPAPRRFSFSSPTGVLGGKNSKLIGTRFWLMRQRLRAQTKNSRLPSPPATLLSK